MWGSTKEAVVRRPAASISSAALSTRWGAMRAMRPSAMPMSTSSAWSRRRARRTIRSMRGVGSDGAGGVLQALPVAAALEADDPAVAGRLEVPGRHQDLLALEPVEERLARLPR